MKKLYGFAAAVFAAALMSLSGYAAGRYDNIVQGDMVFEIEDGDLRFCRLIDYTSVSSGMIDELRIPDTATATDGTVFKVTGIVPSALYGYKIGTLILPDTMRELGSEALSGLNAHHIVLSRNLRQIHAYALSTTVLESIEFPEGLTTISERAAHGNWHLRFISIPSTIKHIGRAAFEECMKLDSIKIYAENPPEIEKEVFGISDDYVEGTELDPKVDTARCVLKVPAGCVEKYRKAKGWSIFRHIESMTPEKTMRDDIIKQMATASGHPKIRTHRNGITVEADGENTRVEVYDLRGVCIRTVDAGDATTLPLPQGIYVVKCGDEAHKIMIK